MVMKTRYISNSKIDKQNRKVFYEETYSYLYFNIFPFIGVEYLDKKHYLTFQCCVYLFLQLRVNFLGILHGTFLRLNLVSQAKWVKKIRSKKQQILLFSWNCRSWTEWIYGFQYGGYAVSAAPTSGRRWTPGN